MSAHLQEPPQPPIVLRPDLPKGLSDIIVMAMAKDPKDRFQSADALSNALRSVLPAATGAGIVSPVPGTARVPQAIPAAPAAQIPLQPTVPLAVAAPSQAAPSSSRRGVYMALGGFLVVVILFAGGFYLPRVIKTHASQGSAATEPAAKQATDTPADNPTPPPDAAPAPAPSAPAAVTAPPPAPAPAVHQEDPAVAKARMEAEQKEREEAARKAAELKEAEGQSDQLQARAAAITQGLDNLRRAQNAQGYGLRGDISSAEQLMQVDLARAQTALETKDGAQAKEYLDKAEAQASIIERFLGR